MQLSSKVYFVTGVLLFAVSCEKKETEGLQQTNNIDVELSQNSIKPSDEAARSTKREPQDTPNQASNSKHPWLGKPLLAKDEALFDQWTQDLSRNANEKKHREKQLLHMLRAEVLDWGLSDSELELVKKGDEPTKIELPFFNGQKLAVVVKEARRFGDSSLNVEGHLASDPNSKVHLSLTKTSPTATIEGSNTLYYYETFENVVILREDEPGSQNADFDCDCEVHRTTH